MILDAVLLVFQGVLNILLLPLTAVNVAIDFVSAIPLVTEFLQIAVYMLPWSNILPLISFVIALFAFRIAVAIFRFIREVLPI